MLPRGCSLDVFMQRGPLPCQISLGADRLLWRPRRASPGQWRPLRRGQGSGSPFQPVNSPPPFRAAYIPFLVFFHWQTGTERPSQPLSLPGTLGSFPHFARERTRTQLPALTVCGAPHGPTPPPRAVLGAGGLRTPPLPVSWESSDPQKVPPRAASQAASPQSPHSAPRGTGTLTTPGPRAVPLCS